ncbi:NTP transferase domain-containing protein [Nocardia sp. NPDC048505]|uniref:nucleotidyltransferase family protein n=1 Tax=Nocardia sp. NPDC048505 TaxID=3155756 RepID=UPI0033E77451
MVADCAGIVLAAGAGRRFGYPKVLAAEGNWLRTAVSALRGGGCAPVVVVVGATGPAALTLPDGVRQVWAADWATGLSASLRAGLGAVAAGDAEYAVIMPVDTPDVGAAVVARVIAAAHGAPSGLARAVFRGRPGHPVALARAHWPAISAAAVGDSGARGYLAARTDTVGVACDDLATGIDHDFRAP